MRCSKYFVIKGSVCWGVSFSPLSEPKSAILSFVYMERVKRQKYLNALFYNDSTNRFKCYKKRHLNNFLNDFFSFQNVVLGTNSASLQCFKITVGLQHR